MGAERRSMVMTEEEKRNTAYHESGHAIVGLSVPEHDPVYKVTIIPRGRALGVTMFLPEQDRYSTSKRQLESRIATLFGGRVAEELVFGPDAVTTGASNDIERATELARNMVTRWGLSDRLGPQTYSEESGEVFLGRSVTQHKQVSDVTAHVIDEEVDCGHVCPVDLHDDRICSFKWANAALRHYKPENTRSKKWKGKPKQLSRHHSLPDGFGTPRLAYLRRSNLD